MQINCWSFTRPTICRAKKSWGKRSIRWNRSGASSTSNYYLLYLSIPGIRRRPISEESKKHPAVKTSTHQTCPKYKKMVINILIMVLISDIDTHVMSNLCYLICSMRLIRSRVVTYQKYFAFEKTYFSSCLRNIFWVTMLYKYHALTILHDTFLCRGCVIRPWIRYSSYLVLGHMDAHSGANVAFNTGGTG